MAPVTPASGVFSDVAARLGPREASGVAPTKTLPLAIRDIFVRQVVTITSTPETTEESASNNSLSSGAVAGIVIGSIVGFLLLLWIVRSCGKWSRPNDWAEKDAYEDRRRRRGRSPGGRHRRRHQHHYHHETSRSRHPSRLVNEVRNSQPVIYETRRHSTSPVPPAHVYRSSRSRTRY
ncbi:hypothetical protein EsH8_I_000557 [Colletotrichum jinshuiense]